MSILLNIPDENLSGVYTIINQRTGKKYIGSSLNLKTRAEVHKREIVRGKHNNKLIQKDIENNDDFVFNIVNVIDECSCFGYEELRTKTHLEEYKEIIRAIENNENLYNLETIEKINGRIKNIQRNLEKVLKRKEEIQKLLKLPNNKLLHTYKHDIYQRDELKLFEDEILKRMN